MCGGGGSAAPPPEDPEVAAQRREARQRELDTLAENKEKALAARKRKERAISGARSLLHYGKATGAGRNFRPQGRENA